VATPIVRPHLLTGLDGQSPHPNAVVAYHDGRAIVQVARDLNEVG